MPVSAVGAKALELAQHECSAIAAALCPGAGVHESVHGARKGIRRLRALLRLFDASDLDLATEDQRLRRIGKGLSALRDSHVVIESARGMEKKYPDLPWGTILRRLDARREHVLAAELDKDPSFARRRKAVQKVAELLSTQPWPEVKSDAIWAGYKRSERRVVKVRKKAAGSDDVEVLHRWRRAVRRLRMQIEAMQALGVDVSSKKAVGKAKVLHQLSDRLGRRQDLRMLRNLVRVMTGIEHRKLLIAAIEEELARAVPN
ncbi:MULTISPECIES: CHAD domain-containing protein [Stenotrophomonas]|uniref:CHAD domain-containing protein n=1 Tax=Stenotrophomonas lactitubi TaxID=2045214 RepID=A0AAW4GIB5_9GAMM|nr:MULTISPECIES: CHAD domain-containing protein [Stenotrophomonas]MBM9913905.1 CHAD domain-containing protein [Stenotrophomonas lactitubi]MBM9921898.1 CHAD domain-containing protein [Stenotrophomonas lactitubi]MBM9938930.1 CHAD domain-containing protein [Stenotrophomonas lactitubi]